MNIWCITGFYIDNTVLCVCVCVCGLSSLYFEFKLQDWTNSFSLNSSRVLFCPPGWGSITWSPSQGPVEGFGPAVCACSVAQLCLTLCNPLDCSPPGSSVHGISQARILEWVAISSFSLSSWLRIQPASPALADGFFTAEPLGKPMLIFSAWKRRMQEWRGSVYCLEARGRSNAVMEELNNLDHKVQGMKQLESGDWELPW